MSNFQQAQIMKAQDILDLTGQKIDPDILTVHPTGNLIHVLLEKMPKEYGTIILPDTIGRDENMGAGYIIAAGSRAGHNDYAAPGPGAVGVIEGVEEYTEENEIKWRTGPAQLLSLHVIFGSHTGMPLRVSMMDREFRSAVLVMSAKDIRGVDVNLTPLTKRVEDKVKVDLT